MMLAGALPFNFSAHIKLVIGVFGNAVTHTFEGTFMTIGYLATPKVNIEGIFGVAVYHYTEG